MDLLQALPLHLSQFQFDPSFPELEFSVLLEVAEQ
jgi:hypothetical protein